MFKKAAFCVGVAGCFSFHSFFKFKKEIVLENTETKLKWDERPSGMKGVGLATQICGLVTPILGGNSTLDLLQSGRTKNYQIGCD